MNILVWIIFGALTGWIASILMKRDGQQGAIGNIIVGLIGALIGGFVMGQFGGQGVTGFNLSSLLVAVIGAVILIFIFNAVQGAKN